MDFRSDWWKQLPASWNFSLAARLVPGIDFFVIFTNIPRTLFQRRLSIQNQCALHLTMQMKLHSISPGAQHTVLTRIAVFLNLSYLKYEPDEFTGSYKWSVWHIIVNCYFLNQDLDQIKSFPTMKKDHLICVGQAIESTELQLPYPRQTSIGWKRQNKVLSFL